MARSKAYLFGGVEIRWNCDPELIAEKDDTPPKAVFHFPGGLKDYLEASLGAERSVTDRNLRRQRAKRPGGHGSVEWAVTWHGGDGFVQLLLQHHPHARRRHARGGPANRR
jgi:topoisomerase-4 subunit B